MNGLAQSKIAADYYFSSLHNTVRETKQRRCVAVNKGFQTAPNNAKNDFLNPDMRFVIQFLIPTRMSEPGCPMKVVHPKESQGARAPDWNLLGIYKYVNVAHYLTLCLMEQLTYKTWEGVVSNLPNAFDAVHCN